MKNIITFTDAMGSGGVALPPVPAATMIPDWYKKTDSYIGGLKLPNGNGGNNASIKRCMPVFDAITSGYLLLLPADVYVTQKDDAPYYEWSLFDLISFHPVEQAEFHPKSNGHSYPKFVNPWAIKTPKGYSTLFVEPMHRELPFNVMPGVVDTDEYTAPVNIVFTLKDPMYQGLIPKGTPIAQVIPFKRDSWSMEIGSKEDVIGQAKVSALLNTRFFDRYKTLFRSIKEYK
jgi:hypothetical protein